MNVVQLCQILFVALIGAFALWFESAFMFYSAIGIAFLALLHRA